MWKLIVDGISGSAFYERSAVKLGDLPWRKLLADAGLIVAFAVTASWLSR